jgi:hypothetical protein
LNKPSFTSTFQLHKYAYDSANTVIWNQGTPQILPTIPIVLYINTLTQNYTRVREGKHAKSQKGKKIQAFLSQARNSGKIKQPIQVISAIPDTPNR